jgi:hypothetical protein
VKGKREEWRSEVGGERRKYTEKFGEGKEDKRRKGIQENRYCNRFYVVPIPVLFRKSSFCKN